MLFYAQRGSALNICVHRRQAAARSEVKFDIAFLDIEIGPVSGLDVGKAMRKNNPNIVFYSCYGVFEIPR